MRCKTKHSLWNLDPSLRLEVMERMISAPKGWNPKKQSQLQTATEELAAHYGCTVQIKRKEESDVAGYFLTGGVLVIVVTPDESKEYVLTPDDLVSTFCHELAHRIQWIFYGDPRKHIPHYGRRISANLKYEREACRLSYRIWKRLFRQVCPELRWADFDCYRSKAQQDILLTSRMKDDRKKG